VSKSITSILLSSPDVSARVADLVHKQTKKVAEVSTILCFGALIESLSTGQANTVQECSCGSIAYRRISPESKVSRAFHYAFILRAEWLMNLETEWKSAFVE
jgi:hypothetical protein